MKTDCQRDLFVAQRAVQQAEWVANVPEPQEFWGTTETYDDLDVIAEEIS